MHYVYVLKKRAERWFYIGSTLDLRRRFAQHHNGQVKSTKGHRPLDLMYYEEYGDVTSALRREIRLKTNAQEKALLIESLEVMTTPGEVA